jgi:hypothetical protein
MPTGVWPESSCVSPPVAARHEVSLLSMCTFTARTSRNPIHCARAQRITLSCDELRIILRPTQSSTYNIVALCNVASSCLAALAFTTGCLKLSVRSSPEKRPLPVPTWCLASADFKSTGTGGCSGSSRFAWTASGLPFFWSTIDCEPVSC